MQHIVKSEQGGSTENGSGVYLASFGAAQTVTGSKQILYTPYVDILIDCGLFQGIKSLRIKNRETPYFEIERFGALCLTHAHLDHFGYIPKLVGAGYRGKIYMTAPTREFTELILRDSAKIQEEDSWKANHYGYPKHHPAKPLYTLTDVERCLHHFVTIEPGVEINIAKQVSMNYMISDHISRACSITFIISGKKYSSQEILDARTPVFWVLPSTGRQLMPLLWNPLMETGSRNAIG